MTGDYRTEPDAYESKITNRTELDNYLYLRSSILFVHIIYETKYVYRYGEASHVTKRESMIQA